MARYHRTPYLVLKLRFHFDGKVQNGSAYRRFSVPGRTWQAQLAKTRLTASTTALYSKLALLPFALQQPRILSVAVEVQLTGVRYRAGAVTECTGGPQNATHLLTSSTQSSPFPEVKHSLAQSSASLRHPRFGNDGAGLGRPRGATCLPSICGRGSRAGGRGNHPGSHLHAADLLHG
jgi:hypothetical protein